MSLLVQTLEMYLFSRSKNVEIGFFTALNYKNIWSHIDSGISRSYSVDGNDIQNDFIFNEYSHEVDVSGLISIGLIHGDDVYQFNTLISRVTESRVEQYAGTDGDSSLQIRGHNIDWGGETVFISANNRSAFSR